MLHLLLRTTVYPGLQHHFNEELWEAVLSLPFFTFFIVFIYLNINHVYLNSQSEYCIFNSGPQSSQYYSTFPMKGSGELFFPYFSRFHFFILITRIPISFTSILSINIMSFTQDHS